MIKDELLKPSVVVLKCVDPETHKIIGCVHTEIEKDTMNVGMLCVLPNLQGKGLGKQIIAKVDQLAKDKGCKASSISVLSRRTELLEFYQRRGYNFTGEKFPWTNDCFGKPKIPLEFLVLKKECV